jgi:hypothetical protein
MSFLSRTALPSALFVLVASAPAQQFPQTTSQFDVTGIIQAATVNDAADALSGGTVTINNQQIVVPANTILQMPARALSWQQVFALAPTPWGPLQSGLALSDIPAPKQNFTAHVIGNRVGNDYIAGLVFLSHGEAQVSAGFINYIDYSTGFFRVGGQVGNPNSGQRVHINDPDGRFGIAWSPDPRFTIDEGNPTVRSVTGFPMGIPRTSGLDPLCPQTNRPIDPTSPSGFALSFTMPSPALVASGTPNPSVMAPFEVGDWVTYNGVLIDDGEPCIAAVSVIAKLAIFTAPGTNPAYVVIDAMEVGVGGLPVGAAGEATTRGLFEGFTTDPTRVVNMWGVDVNPCTGVQTLRDWGAASVDPGPPNGAIPGRWRFDSGKARTGGGGGGGARAGDGTPVRMPIAGTFLPAVREMRVELAGNTHALNANGLVTAAYQAPIYDFIFAEGAIGAVNIANNFQEFPFLAQGSGPLDGGPVVGQLQPWPGSVAPTPAACATTGVIIASAGADQTVNSGSLVSLSARMTRNTLGVSVSYTWTQLGGPAVTCNGASTASPSFVAPILPPNRPTVLTFQVQASGGGQTSTDTVDINVRGGTADTIVATSAVYRTSKRRIDLTATSTAGAGSPPAQLSMQAYDLLGRPIGVATALSQNSNGTYSVVVTGVAQPATIEVVSSYGGRTTTPVVITR